MQAEVIKTQAETLFANPKPLPNYIGGIGPGPGDHIALSDKGSIDGICMELLIEPLLRRGDDYMELFKNFRLLLDWQPLVLRDTERVEVPPVHLFDENHNIIASGAYAQDHCWDAPLSLGKHVTELTIWLSTGEVFTYMWAFEVTEP